MIVTTHSRLGEDNLTSTQTHTHTQTQIPQEGGRSVSECQRRVKRPTVQSVQHSNQQTLNHHDSIKKRANAVPSRETLQSPDLHATLESLPRRHAQSGIIVILFPHKPLQPSPYTPRFFPKRCISKTQPEPSLVHLEGTKP